MIQLSAIVFITTIIAFSCCNIKNTIVLHLLFIIFTISSSVYISYITIHYDAIIILQSGFSTSIIVILTTLYSLYCYSYDQEFYIYIGVIINLSFAAVSMAIISLFFPYNSTLQFIICLVFVVLFTIYLFYDLMLLYNKNNELLYESPIHACINIYLDIINIFLELLRIFNSCESN